MTQAERRLYLIRSLLNEKTENQSLNVPRDAGEQRKLLRSLMNVRMPKVADEAFLRVQDEYLQQELADEGVTDLDDLRPVVPGVATPEPGSAIQYLAAIL